MSHKTNKELLTDFLRNNKVRREKIAIRLGYKDAASYISYLKGEIAPEISTSPAPIDIVVAFDTTGSMSSYISNVRKHVRELIGELFKNTPNLKMKIVAFGDYCDMPSNSMFGNAYQQTQLTDNQNDLIKFVQDAKNTIGGDSDEFYELVIKKITEETPWRDGKRSVLLIGDADPHSRVYNHNGNTYKIDWREEAQKASKLNIQFDTLRIHERISWYKELSEITNGVCSNFKNAEKITEVMRAATYSRGSTVETKAMFKSSMDSAIASGDKEVIAMYEGMSKNIVD